MQTKPALSPEEIHARLAEAFTSGDLEAMLDLCEEGAAMAMPPHGEVAVGRDAIRAGLEPSFALRPVARIEVLSKIEAGGMALTRARWNLDGTDPDGHPVAMTGLGAIVSRRQADGRWLIVIDDPLGPGG